MVPLQTISPTPVVELFEDLRDGTLLIKLLEVLTNEKLKLQRGNLVFHRRNNINTALQVLQDQGVKLVNISSDDIEGGNPKLTLALIWLIALHFNGQKLVNSLGATSLEKNLLQWANGYTEKYGLQVLNFQSSWSDGRAFLYILHEALPRGSCDLQYLFTLPPVGRLQQAFSIARASLAIDQLLDPEDVHTTKPDKKSILMYVLSIYHALQSNSNGMKTSDEVVELQEQQQQQTPQLEEDTREESYNFVTTNVTNTDDNVYEVDDDEDYNGQTPESMHSRPISTATNMSMEINSYQSAIEEVLTLLLESEDVLSREIPVFKDLEDAKAKFREHEEFMLKLSNHQRYVGSALEEGARLISESQFAAGLSTDEQNEIKQQMFLLNERWETLRIQAMDVQSKIHSQLAAVESRKIDDLREFLTATEDRISRYGAIRLTSRNLDEHFEELCGLQEDLEEQQKLVDSLGNLIVIVDDDTQNFHDLEDKLAALGERWSHVVQWTQARLRFVQSTKEELATITSQYGQLKQWINTRERELKLMESKEVSEMGDVIRRIRELEYCSMDMDECARQVAELDVKISNLAGEGDDSDEFTMKLAEDTEALIDQIEALRQIIEVQKLRLADMGFEFSGVAEKPSNWTDFQLSSGVEDNQAQSKKAKLEKTDKILDLELKIIDMLNFIDGFTGSLNRIQDHAGSEDESEQLRKTLSDRIKEYADVKELLDMCKLDVGVDLSVEENQLQAIGSKYDEFVFRLEDIDNRIYAEQLNTKFQKSLTGLKLVLAELRDWYKQNGNEATVEELQDKLKSMDSLSSDIMETRMMCENNTDSQFLAWKGDFEQFLQSWRDMQNAIRRLIEELSSDLSSADLIALESCLGECEAAKVVCREVEAMVENVSFLNELAERLHSLEVEDATVEFQERSAAASKVLKSKIMSQTIILENVHHFQKEHKNIVTEMEKLEKGIRDIQLENSQRVEQQNEKLKLFGIEIKKLEIDIISLKNFCEIITTNDYSKYTDEVKEIVARHGQLVDLYKEKKSKVQSVAPKVQAVIRQIQNIEKWLITIKKDAKPLQMEAIKTPNDLFKEKLKFQGIKEICDAKTIEFKELNETANEILIAVDDSSEKTSTDITNMVKALTKVNAYWSEVTNDIYNKAAVLERVSSQFGEFRTLISQANGYFDKLQQTLNKSMESAADAEEICEELDDLENIIRSHSGERLEKIIEIGTELIGAKFIEGCISDDIAAIRGRWDDLQEKANTRAQMLDTAAKEAQGSESKVSYLQDWIAKVDLILSEHIENDVGVEDLPHDFQVC